MLDIKYIREHREEIDENNKNRNAKVDLDQLLEIDEKRRTFLQKIEAAQTRMNQKSKEKPTAEEIEALKRVKEEIRKLEDERVPIEAEYGVLLSSVPNLTHPKSPVGKEENFTTLETHGDIPTFVFTPKNHEQLLTARSLIDFERGAKVAGAKFYFSKGDLVRLNQALIQYGIDVVTAHGYELMETPDLAQNKILSGTGYSPRGSETQIYSIEHTDLSLIATAEITMGGYHADEILDLSNGPKKYVALSHCFRTEAGGYGRTSKGLYRVHQFTKLEMFVYCKPGDSERMHQELLDIEKEIVSNLGISYRVIDIATGDLGAPAYRKLDIEAWMVMKEGYGEITSTSNCTDYQSRNLNIRYRTEEGKTAFVHTLNGTAIVTSRMPIAIVEQYQQADGTIRIPDVLKTYMGGKTIIQ